MTTHKKYAAEQKLAAVELFLSGVDEAEVIRRLEINNRALLSKWVAIYSEQGAQGLEPRPKGRPKKDLITAKETDAMRIQRLEMEVEILKKYNALLAEEDYAQRIKRKSSRH
jgi:transposase-like protein